MKKKIGFIGAGNMAGAIIEGILKSNMFEASQITVCDKIEEKRTHFENKGLVATESIEALAESCDIIFLAVKPQDYENVLKTLNGIIDESKLIVTIAAGISTKYIKDIIGFDCKVVRAMPNTPLLLSEGATALCHVEPVKQDEFDMIRKIFEAGGLVCELPEEKMNAVISVNSTSPVYVYLLAKAVIDGGVQQGIDAESAKRLFCKTLIGSAKMIMESGKTPDELIKMVASPGGTTLKALEALYSRNFEDAVKEAMLCCTKRAGELGR